MPPRKQLTVEALIKLLEAVKDKSKLVDSEGCDCDAPAVCIEEDSTSVLISRGD